MVNVMKLIKFSLLVFVLSALLCSCDKEYNNITGEEFKGTFVWKYYESTAGAVRIDNYIDTLFIEVKETEILTYRYAMRDSSLSYAYALSSDDEHDLHSVPLTSSEDIITNISNYPYWATYRFAGDTLYIETYPVKGNNLPDKGKKPLFRNAYVRPTY